MTPILRKDAFAKRILTWYAKGGRHDLPWQKNPSPYRVWISEIMLQQTQVNTVIPYYQAFMRRFPNVATLAKANLDEVLHHWSGLGYYSRARHIHKAAQLIYENYAGFPNTLEELIALPGIGRSTAGAIMAFGFKQRAAILDGNVKRVLARIQTVEGWPGQKTVHDLLWQYAEYYTPEENVAEYTQAMMDLGALICTKTKPSCDACPLNDRCHANLTQQQHQYPTKSPKTKKPVRQVYMILLTQANGHYCLQKREPTGIWGGLYGFPEFTDLSTVHEHAKRNWKISIKEWQTLPSFKHTFSHFHLMITPIRIELPDQTVRKLALEDSIWYNIKKPANIGLAAPVKKLLTSLEKIT